MPEATNGHGESRLDRMERLMDLLINDRLQFQDEHKSLLRAQVLLTEQQERTAKTVDALAERVDSISRQMERLTQAQKELYEAQKHTDERLDALIATVDDIIRGRPRPPR